VFHVCGGCVYQPLTANWSSLILLHFAFILHSGYPSTQQQGYFFKVWWKTVYPSFSKRLFDCNNLNTHPSATRTTTSGSSEAAQTLSITPQLPLENCKLQLHTNLTTQHTRSQEIDIFTGKLHHNPSPSLLPSLACRHFKMGNREPA
jgi:spore germination protein YaaH